MNSGKSTFPSSSKARDCKEDRVLFIASYIGLAALVGMVVLLAIFLLRPPCGKSISGMITSDFKPMQNALDLYKLEGGSYPITAQGLKALVEKPVSEPLPAKWQQIMTTEPLDPWRKPYGYKFPGSKDPTQPELICAGHDGIFGNEDDFSSQGD